MADNYLERRYDEVFGGKKSAVHPVSRHSLGQLLTRNRSYRGYDASYVVQRRQLETIISVNTLVASGMNAQRLRFYLATKEDGADIVMKSISQMGAALTELHLPLPGTEPNAFIVVCSICAENPIIDIDLGISLQSMLLKAVDMNLGGIIIRSFDRKAVSEGLHLPYEPLAVLAVGKPAETIKLVPVKEGDDLKYYRKDGIHYVPKIAATDLILNRK